jgi:hypothetical protein
MEWVCGLTTVPSRFDGLLPKTLASLRAGGFPNPRLFIDGAGVPDGLDLPISLRIPPLRPFGNWALGLAELYLREPHADRYAMFQDDLLCYRNLRTYLDACTYPEKGYWNLITQIDNEKVIGGKPEGWRASNQRGRGAVALVFSNEAVRVLLKHPHMVDRPLDPKRGWRTIDGGIVESFRKARWEEWVHNPSLVLHTGEASTIIERRVNPDGSIREVPNKRYAPALTWRGEDYDALSLPETARDVVK